MLKVGRDQNLDSLNLPFLKFENCKCFCAGFLLPVSYLQMSPS